MLNLTIYRTIKEASVVTMKCLQGELAKVKKDVKTMRLGPVPGVNDEMKSFTEEEQRHHIRSKHAVYDKRCELCVQTRGLSCHRKRVEAETVREHDRRSCAHALGRRRSARRDFYTTSSTEGCEV